MYIETQRMVIRDFVGLMKKLGMQQEGIQRSQTVDPRGNWADMYLYGLLKEERREI